MSPSSTDPGSPAAVAYGIDDLPPLARAVPLGVQHVLAMLVGNITPPLLLAGALALDVGTTATLLQAVLVMAGVATLVQSYPIGPVGGRIPVIMGTSIAFLGASVAAGRQFGLGAVFGACAVAALVEVVLGFSIVRVRRFFPPLVSAVVLMLIGLTLIPVGMDYAAGGPGAADYGSVANLTIAAVVFVVTLLLQQFARGFLRHASLLLGTLAGYGLAVALGRVDFGPVAEAGWLSFPRPLQFGFELHWTPILVLGLVYVVSAIETMGDIAGILAAAGREPTDRELRGGLVADGVMSGVAALFGALPNTSYSQNVGLVNFTGILSRHVTAIGGVVLVLLGVVPKVSALFATVPRPVIGGGGVILFAMIFSSGVAIVHRSEKMTQRTMVILAVSIGLGLGVELRPAALGQLPEGLRLVLGSGLLVGGLTALLLNVVLPTGRAETREDTGGPTATRRGGTR